MGHVQSIIQVCRDMAPKYMSTELAKRLNSIISQIFCVPYRFLKVLRNHLFLRNTNPKGDMADEYCQFVTDLAAGLPIKTSFIVNNRTFNYRGGEGIGCTKFEVFFEECR